MWTKLLKSSFLLGLLLIGLRSFAGEISLPTLREEVLNQNLDIRIQYEKFYQAQKGIAVARGEFLPSANIQLINVSATLAILQAVVPTPSDWFAYQGSFDLAAAETFTTEGIKLNILEALTINYVAMKYYETLMESMADQEAMLVNAHEAALNEFNLGGNNAQTVYLAQRQLLQHRQDMYALESLSIAEKQAMLVALGRDAGEELTLGEMPADDLDLIPETKEEAAKIAIRNSNELVSNSYQYEAAQWMVGSQRWSFVSFNGIGFDYASRLSIEKSKARIISLEGEKLRLKIRNQVYAAYKQLNIFDQRITLQKSIVEATKSAEERQVELYANRLVTLTNLTDAKANTIAETRTLVKLELERKTKIIQLKRLLGLDSSLGDLVMPVAEDFTLTHDVTYYRRGGKKVTLNLIADEKVLANVLSVTYIVDGVASSTRLRAQNRFNYTFSPSSDEVTVVTRIQPLTGEAIETATTISLR